MNKYPPGHNPFSGVALIPGENAPNRNFFFLRRPTFSGKSRQKACNLRTLDPSPAADPAKTESDGFSHLNIYLILIPFLKAHGSSHRTFR